MTSQFSFVNEFFKTIKDNFSHLILTKQAEKEITKDWTGFKQEGAYATVSKGTLFGIPVAYKNIRLNMDEVQFWTSQKPELNAIISELKIMSKVFHSNIPQLYGITIDHQKVKLNLIMQYIDGKSLKALNEEQKTCPDMNYYQKAWMLFKLAKILVYIRKIGIIHRDIKPENILIENDSNLEPYLIDFGLSKIRKGDSEWTETFQKCSPLYSPPENIFSPEEYSYIINSSEKSMLSSVDDNTQLTKINYKVDVWSLGCVVYEVFTGKTPWKYLAKIGKEIKPNQIYDFFHDNKRIFSDEDVVNYPDIINIVDNCTQQNVKERWEIEKACDEIEKILVKKRVKIKETLYSSEYCGEALSNNILNNNDETINTTNTDNYDTTFDANNDSPNDMDPNESYLYDGKGKLSYTNSNDGCSITYTGCFQFGNKYDFGIEYSDDDNYYYQGLWKNQLKSGDGYLRQVEYEEEIFYLGSFKNDKKQGYGTYVTDDFVSSGYFYNDDLVEGFRHCKIKNIIYKGYFIDDNLKYGEVIYLDNNEIYCGEFSDKMRNGYGYVKKIIDGKEVISQYGYWNNDDLEKEVDLNN